MPIYEYECKACGEHHEFIQKFSEGAKRKCPACGKSRLRKLMSAAAFHLKGSGWYVTDFRDGDKKKPDEGSGSDKSADASAAESSSESKSESTDKAQSTPAGKSESGSDSKPTVKKKKAPAKSAKP